MMASSMQLDQRGVVFSCSVAFHKQWEGPNRGQGVRQLYMVGQPHEVFEKKLSVLSVTHCQVQTPTTGLLGGARTSASSSEMQLRRVEGSEGGYSKS